MKLLQYFCDRLHIPKKNFSFVCHRLCLSILTKNNFVDFSPVQEELMINHTTTHPNWTRTQQITSSFPYQPTMYLPVPSHRFSTHMLVLVYQCMICFTRRTGPYSIYVPNDKCYTTQIYCFIVRDVLQDVRVLSKQIISTFLKTTNFCSTHVRV